MVTVLNVTRSNARFLSQLPISVTLTLPVTLTKASICISWLMDAKHSSTGSNTKTHFGFQEVPETEKQNKVNEVFANVADKYDIMNDAMSGGVHRLWKDTFVRRLGPSVGIKHLDVAGGTGDIAFRIIDYVNNTYPKDYSMDFSSPVMKMNQDSSGSSESSDDDVNSKQCCVTVCDINKNMLEVGRKRAQDRLYLNDELEWVEGNAEQLSFVDNSFDSYTIAFGIRNCTHINKVLREALRVLRPGGRFMCLEFSTVKNPLISKLYERYSMEVIPVVGQVIAGDWHSYQYLVESIRRFPNQERFATMIREAGFSEVQYENMTFGVVSIHSGFKL